MPSEKCLEKNMSQLNSMKFNQISSLVKSDPNYPQNYAQELILRINLKAWLLPCPSIPSYLKK